MDNTEKRRSFRIVYYYMKDNDDRKWDETEFDLVDEETDSMMLELIELFYEFAEENKFDMSRIRITDIIEVPYI